MEEKSGQAHLNGREYVVPGDVRRAFGDVGIHRIRLNQKARLNGKRATDILEEICGQIREPRSGEKYR